MTALAVVDESLDVLPPLREAIDHVESLVQDGCADLLTDARRKAEAYALYEKLRHNTERERHFRKMILITEAGIGSLSFDDPDLIPSTNERNRMRALASAFERGCLLRLMGEAEEHKKDLVYLIREQGYTWVPGQAIKMPGSAYTYSQARKHAIEAGISLRDLPNHEEHARLRAQAAQEAADRRYKREEKKLRALSLQERLDTERAARKRGGSLASAYAHIRKALQDLDDAYNSLSEAERKSEEWEPLHRSLYRCEDNLGALLRGDLNRGY